MPQRKQTTDNTKFRCELCDKDQDTSVFAKLGHDLVKQVNGHEIVMERIGSDNLNQDIYEEIGQQVIHSGGPTSKAGLDAYADLSDRFAKKQILPRISDEIIEEHAENPIGQHSDDLQRVLHYFRRQPNDGKYVIIETERSKEWAIGVLSGERGTAPEILEERFESPEKAAHEIFVRRVSEFNEKYR